MTSPNDGVELRIVVPREMFTTTTQPEFFSQLNCGLLGISKRTFLELLRDELRVSRDRDHADRRIVITRIGAS